MFVMISLKTATMKRLRSIRNKNEKKDIGKKLCKFCKVCDKNSNEQQISTPTHFLENSSYKKYYTENHFE